MEKVLILGASGLVGSAIIEEFKDKFDLYGTYSSSMTSLTDGKKFQLKVQQLDKMRQIIRQIKPDVVISCLRGNFDHQLQFHKELAMEIRNSNSRLYFFSTTNVFDGDFSKAHTETDIPISESDYGKFKMECENMLKEVLAERVVIIRIPAIWGKDSPRWNSIIESIRKNQRIDVYRNLICNNHLDVLLAKQLRFIIDHKLEGIFHLVSTDLMTQGQFYEQIIHSLAGDKRILQYSEFQGDKNKHYFALTSTREDLPSSLQCINREIIA